MTESTKRFSPGALSRRDALLGIGASGVALSTAGSARAEDRSLVVSNWGGDWNERTIKFVEAPLLKAKGITITHDLGMEPERKTKLLAERRLRRGTVDVIHINEGDSYELFSQDVLADIDFSKVPNYADVGPALKTRPYFVPWLYSGVVIVYNKDKVPNPPQSYEELWDKKWAGKLGLTNQLYFNYVMMASLIKGGNVNNADAGKARLMQLKELTQPRIYPAHQQLAAGLTTGEVDIAINYKARGLQWAHDGAPLAIQYPKEGAIAVMFGAALPKRAPRPDLANVYFNDMLDRKAMAGLAGASFYAPANSKAELAPDLRAKIDFTGDEQKALKFPDYAFVAKNTAEWLEWWNKKRHSVSRRRRSMTSTASSAEILSSPRKVSRRAAPVTGLLAPATLFVVLVLLGPLALMFRYSFNRFVPIELMVSALSLENYVKFFSDSFYQEVLWTTLWVSSLSTFLCLLAGFPIAYFMVRQASPRMKSWMLILVILPLLMGNAVRSAAWMVIIGDKGLGDSILGTIGLSLKIMYTPTAVVIGLVSVLLPFMVVTLQSVLEGIDRNLEDAAESLGAHHSTMLRRVLLPLALPGILAGTMLCFILSMNAYATPVLIGGPQFHMMGPTVYEEVAKAMNWPFGAALAFILMAVTLLLATLANVLVQRRYRRWVE